MRDISAYGQSLPVHFHFPGGWSREEWSGLGSRVLASFNPDRKENAKKLLALLLLKHRPGYLNKNSSSNKNTTPDHCLMLQRHYTMV